MAHSDGIRVVRYRSFEEILFNVRAYHNYEPTEADLEAMRSLAGPEERVTFAGSALEHPELHHGAECGLPVFQAIDCRGFVYVCAHLCEID